MTVYFEFQGVSFREIEEGDLSFIQSLRNDFSTWSQLGDPRPLKPGLQKKWLEGLGGSGDRFYFIATTAEDGPVGLIRMDEYDPFHRSIRIGTDVLPALRGKGLGNRIFSAIEKYAFDYLGVHRVWLLVLESNKKARGLYSKRLFRQEGKMREAIYRDGKFINYVIMSLLEADYRKGAI